MRLVLLAGASPLRSSDGPISRLIKGRYLIHVEGLTNSILGLNVDGIPHHEDLSRNERELVLTNPASVQVKFKLRGTEAFLTVVAQRVA